MKQFTPMEKIYVLRFALGFLAALACTGYGLFTGGITSDPNKVWNLSTLMNSITIALAIYLLSYYGIKSKFMTQVTKPTKLVTMGIGIYFITWIVFWVLFYTIIATMPA